MAIRGGAIAALLLVALLALSSSASAQFVSRRPSKQPPRTSTPGDPKKPPRNGKFTTVVANRHHKRNYEITCTTDWGASCYVKCPARCPNKCLAYCAYCLTFCSKFDSWLASGVLKRDDRDSLYVYRQDFVVDGRRRRVAGVIAALGLEEFGPDSGVLPHERTMAGPKKDRLALMSALPVNISPIYGIYRGAGGIGPFIESLEHRPTAARFTDGAGVLHRLWMVNQTGEVEMLSEALSQNTLVIADGHHRYETALEFHRLHGEDAADSGSIMCFCVDADDEELVVLPYNRALRSTTPAEEAKARLRRSFAGREVDASSAEEALAAAKADHPFLLSFGDSWLLAEVSDEQVVATVGDRPRAWRDLDVVALHEVLLPAVFEEGVDELRFSKDPAEIQRLVSEDGWSVGILLAALSAADVVEAAKSGERMPQKASYFWPKAITGLVFRTLG
jgi:uncharacterized protein (DUF1015 family)